MGNARGRIAMQQSRQVCHPPSGRAAERSSAPSRAGLRELVALASAAAGLSARARRRKRRRRKGGGSEAHGEGGNGHKRAPAGAARAPQSHIQAVPARHPRAPGPSQHILSRCLDGDIAAKPQVGQRWYSRQCLRQRERPGVGDLVVLEPQLRQLRRGPAPPERLGERGHARVADAVDAEGQPGQPRRHAGPERLREAGSARVADAVHPQQQLPQVRHGPSAQHCGDGPGLAVRPRQPRVVQLRVVREAF
mmetsp:Transcript_13303/g.37271  ORF Transcript_13303/g.37271 Transcript_13303/m.37271 type:complete len:250 (+) Transcript_13303:97-846(+)